MTDCKLYSLLETAARNWPDDVAIVRGAERLTFFQLKRAAEHLAAQFSLASIRGGDKVGLLCPNGPEYVIGSFALFLSDAVVVPVFPGLKRLEIAALDAALGLDAICYSPEFEDLLPRELGENAIAVDLKEMDATLRIGKSGKEPLKNDDGARRLPDPAPLIRFTSGTTSLSKGVIIPQAAMSEYTRRFIQAYAIQRGDCILDLLSMAHIFYQITAAMTCGAKLVVEDATKTDAVGEILRRERVTHIEAAPSFYSMGRTTTDWRVEDFRQVRHITSCGAPLADPVAAEFRDRFSREIVQRYGLTETGPVLINTNEGARKRGSLGAPAPGCEIRLSSNGAQSSGDFGEIQVRCPGLFAGYFSPWTPQAEILDDGWFCTGDIARKDADGYYWMTGRTKAMINVGAVKVFPSELEEILVSHEAIKEAYVFPVDDARFGEVPHAKVILQRGSARTEQELLRYANRKLSVFKALRGIQVVDQITKTQTGKIKRYESAKNKS